MIRRFTNQDIRRALYKSDPDSAKIEGKPVGLFQNRVLFLSSANTITKKRFM